MFIRKLKLLMLADYLKVSIPLLILLGVFFCSSMIELNIETMFKSRLPDVQSMTVDGIDKQDSDFIQAILKERDLKDLTPFLLSDYHNNGFIGSLYNPDEPEVQTAQETAPEEVQTEQQQIVVIPFYAVSAISKGNVREFAVVNGGVVRPGDRMSNGDLISAISDRGVLIEGQWGKQWFYVTY